MTWNEFISQEIVQIGKIKFLVGNVLLGVGVILLTWLIVFLLRRMITKQRFIIDKIDHKRRMSVFLISKYTIWLISILITLRVVGIDITVLVLGSTVLVVAVGFGLQSIFKD